ncbi:hypothetical protein HAX54_049609, partial [Datura stramonium]|nr:hypothetical protein [Datura stramonium]
MTKNENGVNGVLEVGDTSTSAVSHQVQGATLIIKHNHPLNMHASDNHHSLNEEYQGLPNPSSKSNVTTNMTEIYQG